MKESTEQTPTSSSINPAQDLLETQAATESQDSDAPNGVAQEQPVERRQDSGAAAALRLIEAEDIELFHTPDSEAYATFAVGGHRETWALSSKQFQRWVSKTVYEAEGRALSVHAYGEVANLLEAKAHYTGKEHEVFLRVAEHDNAYYLDLGDDAWQVVRIDENGWEVLDESPVKFARTSSMKALPVPTTGGNLADLRGYLNVTDKEWPLTLGWLAAALKPSGPYPIMVLNGEQSSAKSTTAKVLRALVDPNVTPLRSKPRGAEDLMISAKSNRVVALDNLSHIRSEMSDVMCIISTGGGYSRRKLYSDGDEVTLSFQRPMLMTGITDLINRSDLLSRALILNLPSIAPEERTTEATFWQDFEAAHPQLLGALLTAVSAGLKSLPYTKLDALPRLADFAIWASACEEGLGLPPGRFMEAYSRNIDDSNAHVLEMSPVVTTIIHYLDVYGDSVQMPPAEFYRRLSDFADDQDKRQPEWPKSPKGLTSALKRLAPNLREIGIEYEAGKTSGANSRRYVRLSRSHVPDTKDAEDTEVTS